MTKRKLIHMTRSSVCIHTEHNWGIVDWPPLGRDMKSQFQSVFCVKRVFNSFIACSTVIRIVDLLARHYGMNSSSAAITPSWTKTSLKAIQELVGRLDDHFNRSFTLFDATAQQSSRQKNSSQAGEWRRCDDATLVWPKWDETLVSAEIQLNQPTTTTLYCMICSNRWVF